MDTTACTVEHDARAVIRLCMSPFVPLNGRQFEHFVAEIFRQFSCEVELTTATRDHGRDIVCCRRGGSRPFKFAIETKRYARSRKISVGLINQFLGANRKFNADRLLFVTTSDYTKPALKWARENIDILRVRKFEDVIEWAGRYAEVVERRTAGPGS